jgi:hypothetical protein
MDVEPHHPRCDGAFETGEVRGRRAGVVAAQARSRGSTRPLGARAKVSPHMPAATSFPGARDAKAPVLPP